MPVTRTLLRDFEPDEFGNSAYSVTGTKNVDQYTTRGGDTQLFMLDGADLVNVRECYTDGIGVLQVKAGPGNDTISDLNQSSGEAIYGGDGADKLYISSGDDDSSAHGGNGNDLLVSRGGTGIYLFGDGGADTIRGHNDSLDYVNGGAGKDTINITDSDVNSTMDTLTFFANHTGTGVNRDVVRGFDHDEDIINLQGMDADKRPGHDGNQDFIFDGKVPGGGTPVAPGHVAWFHEGGNIGVAWNNGENVPDGSNGREAVLLLDMQGQDLTQSDFML